MVNPDRVERPEGILFLKPLFVGNYRDDEGRPLGENKTPEECKTHLPMELTRCPYAGSRHNHQKPMNLSALRQVLKHWPEVTAALSFLRNLYMPGRPAGDVTLLEFWKTAKAGSLVPSYLVHRGRGALGDGQLPAFVAALYKTALGLFDTSQHMVFRGIATGEYKKNTRAEAQAMSEFADGQGVLIGSKEVCAGPPNLIKESMLAITEGSDDKSDLSDLIPDPRPFLRYVTQEQLIHILNFLFPLLSYSIVAEVSLAVGAESRRQGTNRSLAQLLAQLSEVEGNHPEVVRSLVDSGKSISSAYINSLNEMILNIDPKTEIAPLIQDAGRRDREEESRLVKIIYSLFGGERPAFAGEVKERLLEVLIEALATYLVMERRRLQCYTIMQTEVNTALARGSAPRPLAETDITQSFGKTLRDVLGDFLSIKIQNTPLDTSFKTRLDTSGSRAICQQAVAPETV